MIRGTRGGVAKGFKRVTICLILLLITTFIISLKLIKMKKNYTDLHRRVTIIEKFI